MAAPATRTVTDRYVPVTVTVPKATPIAAPFTVTPNLGDVILVSVHLTIPAGHAGRTGLRVDFSGATIVPWSNPSAWIVSDDDKFDLSVGIEVGNLLVVRGYNLDDVNDHTFYLLARVTDPVAPIPSTQLLAITPAGAA